MVLCHTGDSDVTDKGGLLGEVPPLATFTMPSSMQGLSAKCNMRRACSHALGLTPLFYNYSCQEASSSHLQQTSCRGLHTCSKASALLLLPWVIPCRPSDSRLAQWVDVHCAPDSRGSVLDMRKEHPAAWVERSIAICSTRSAEPPAQAK